MTVGLGLEVALFFLVVTAGGAGTGVEVVCSFAVGTVSAVIRDGGWGGSRASVRLPLPTGVVAYVVWDFFGDPGGLARRTRIRARSSRCVEGCGVDVDRTFAASPLACPHHHLVRVA